MSDYAVRWVFLAACALVQAVLLAALGVALDLDSARAAAELVGVLLLLGAVFVALGRRLGWALLAAGDAFHSLAQFVAVLLVLVPFSYLAATTGAPLLDAELAALDASLGFDWDTAAAWVADRPVVERVLRTVYFSLFGQTYVVIAFGSLTRPGERNGEAVWLFICAAALTVAVFCFTPALGKMGHLGTSQIDMLLRIREGGWTVLAYERFVGIININFPSFHTTLAILWTYAVRRHRWTLAAMAPFNAVMVAATPAIGGHYLVDTLAGAAVAAAAILVVRRLRKDAPAGGGAAAPAPRPAAAAQAGLSAG